MVAILLFCVMLLFLCFYNSKKVILWESREDVGTPSIFKQGAVIYASAAEDTKAKLGVDDLFQKENALWRSVKESPLVFGQPEASLSLYGDEQAIPSDIENIVELENLPQSSDADAATTSPETEKAESDATEPSNIVPVEKETPAVPNAAKKSAPFRILVVGDSFMAAGGGLGDPLERVLLNYKDTVVTRQGKVSSGLSRQDYFNWPELTQKLIAQHKPNVAIMMFGANDNIPVIDANGALLAGWGSAKWDEQYRQRIDQMLDMFTQANSEIFVIGVPIMKNKTLSRTIAHINSLFEEEVKKYSRVHYISTWNLLCDKDGNYTDSLLDKDGNKRLIRTSDGVHLQYFAGYYVADAITAEMKKYLDIRLK